MEEEYRKPSHRRTVDHGNSFARWIQMRSTGQVISPQIVRPEASYIIDLLPPPAYQNGPRSGGWVATTPSSAVASVIPTKFVHTSINKIKHPVLCVAWTPEGRRLVTGSMSGEFTLWNGMSFNFETIMQAHEGAVRSMKYSHNGDWLLSGDQYGIVKFWQTNFNNVRILEAHREMVRDIAFSPNDTKFVTASDDGTVKIWDFSSNNDTEERVLKGHGWDVRCVDWHPTLGLVVSGSKDNLVKLWDPRNGQCVSTFHGFKNTVTKTQFQPSGTQRLLASASRDQTARIMDLRMMGNNSKAYTGSRGLSSKVSDESMDMATGDKSYAILRGHDADVSALTWHPTHSSLISTGTHQGALCHYLLDSAPTAENTNTILPTVKITAAHDSAIWDIEYHPLGHLLCSGASDRMARFWCRSRPGDPLAFKDKYYDASFEQPSANTHINNNMNNITNNMNNNNNSIPNSNNQNYMNNNSININNSNINNNNSNNNRGNYNNRESNYNKHGDNRGQNNYQSSHGHNNQNNNNNYNRNRNYNNNSNNNNSSNNSYNNNNNSNYNNNANNSNIYSSSHAYANDGMVRDGLSANVYEDGMMMTGNPGESGSAQDTSDPSGQNSGYNIPGLFRN